MNNDLISRKALIENFESRLARCNEWIEKAKDKETKIRADATIAFICEVIMTIDNAQPVEPQKIVTIPPELIEKLASCVVDIVGNIDWEKAIEVYKARRQDDVVYLCDGNNCPAEKASCNHGGPCRHTANIEHAINFRRFHDTDKFYEVENVMRIEGQENQ